MLERPFFQRSVIRGDPTFENYTSNFANSTYLASPRPSPPFYYGVFGFYDQGRVYDQSPASDGWHTGYGGGFYLAPVVASLAFSVSYQQSMESRLIQFELGFRLDK